MNTPLDAIREELGALRPRVGLLEQAEALLAPSYESVEPAREPASRVTRRPARRPGGGNPNRSEICQHVTAHGPITRAQLLAALGGSEHAMSAKLKHLLSDGAIGAAGKPGARRYHAHGAMLGTSLAPPEPGVDPVYDAIVDSGGATTAQLMTRTGLTKSVVIERGRRLSRRGLVHFTDKGAGRVWLPEHQAGRGRGGA